MHTEVPPCLKARIPQERDLVAEVVVGNELLGVIKVVLGTESNDLDLVCMFSGELPDL